MGEVCVPVLAQVNHDQLQLLCHSGSHSPSFVMEHSDNVFVCVGPVVQPTHHCSCLSSGHALLHWHENEGVN